MTDPQKYDLTDPDDRARWFREMKSYLKTSKFTESGTDWEGREFAHEAFLELMGMNESGALVIISNPFRKIKTFFKTVSLQLKRLKTLKGGVKGCTHER